MCTHRVSPPGGNPLNPGASAGDPEGRVRRPCSEFEHPVAHDWHHVAWDDRSWLLAPFHWLFILTTSRLNGLGEPQKWVLSWKICHFPIIFICDCQFYLLLLVRRYELIIYLLPSYKQVHILLNICVSVFFFGTAARGALQVPNNVDCSVQLKTYHRSLALFTSH